MITPAMIQAGVAVLREWLDEDRPMTRDPDLVRAILEACAQGWRPIETAPRKTACLVWDEEPFVLSLVECYGPTMQHPGNSSFECCYEWRDGSGDGLQDWRPTHWMPLPAPP